MSQPLVSKHLRVLKDAGLVQARVDAQRRLYRIRPEPLAELDEWLAPYRALWTREPSTGSNSIWNAGGTNERRHTRTRPDPSPPCGLSAVLA